MHQERLGITDLAGPETVLSDMAALSCADAIDALAPYRASHACVSRLCGRYFRGGF